MIAAHRIPALVAILMLLGTGGALADPAPFAGIARLDQLPVLTSAPYDTSDNADAAIDAALARARKSGKRVLIDLGGNWCPDCIVLANVMLLKNVNPFLAARFEVVAVDVGRFNKNLHVLTRFGLPRTDLVGVPFVIVTDANGTVLNKGEGAKLAEASILGPQAIVDWLAHWTD